MSIFGKIFKKQPRQTKSEMKYFVYKRYYVFDGEDFIQTKSSSKYDLKIILESKQDLSEQEKEIAFDIVKTSYSEGAQSDDIAIHIMLNFSITDPVFINRSSKEIYVTF